MRKRASSPPGSASRGLIDGTQLQTKVGSLLGTPTYMAPEQCQAADVTASADIYSLSVIVYQMFCGCLPFEAKSLTELLKRALRRNS
jgi:eukaryotic-like serine/threonine-protein kinase